MGGVAGAEEGAGGGVGVGSVAWGFDEVDLGGEEVDGGLAGVGGLVGRAAEFGLIGELEEGADAGLIEPDQELREGEVVVGGDGDEGAVGFEEVAEDSGAVDGDAIDVVVDGVLEGGMVLCGEHERNVPRARRDARGFRME
jgi:hypothetical protein